MWSYWRHLFGAAFQSALSHMGTTYIAVGLALAVYIVILLRRMVLGGLSAVKDHFTGDARLSFYLILGAWTLLVIWCLVSLIYTEHRDLTESNRHLSDAINGEHGYKAQISDLNGKLSSATNSVNELQHSVADLQSRLSINETLLAGLGRARGASHQPPPEIRDPDSFYQLGQAVATVT